MSSQSINKLEVPLWRILLVYALGIVVIGALIYRLFSLQVVDVQTWLGQAVENYTSEINDPASRGIIYDRNGYILARNVASYNVVITPAALPNDDADIQNIYRELSALIDVPVNEGDVEFAKLFSACIPGPGIAQIVELGDSIAPYTPVRVKCNISEELARVIREKSTDWPGVTVEIEPIRDYLSSVLKLDLRA